MPARSTRTEKLRLDRALSRAFAETGSDASEPALASVLHELHLGARRRSRLLSPTGEPAQHDPARALVNLARFHEEFRRPISTWNGAGLRGLAAVSSLATHLFDAWPTPRFLASAWFGAEREPCRWFLEHARGRPFRRVGLPFVMTRRMERLFLASPDHLGVHAALRRAEVLGSGGTPELAEAVLGTRLAGSFEHPGFWRGVVQFLVRHQERLSPGAVGAIVEGLHRLRHEPVEVHTPGGVRREAALAPELSLRGRGLRSVLDMARDAYGDPGRTWSSSGYREVVFEEAGVGQAPERWCVVELLDARRLRAEAHALHHCVRTYTGACRRGQTSIWSIRRQLPSGTVLPVLTVEVEPRRRVVVQAKGRFNRAPEGRPLEILRRWARREGLGLSLKHDRAVGA